MKKHEPLAITMLVTASCLASCTVSTVFSRNDPLFTPQGEFEQMAMNWHRAEAERLLRLA